MFVLRFTRHNSLLAQGQQRLFSKRTTRFIVTINRKDTPIGWCASMIFDYRLCLITGEKKFALLEGEANTIGTFFKYRRLME